MAAKSRKSTHPSTHAKSGFSPASPEGGSKAASPPAQQRLGTRKADVSPSPKGSRRSSRPQASAQAAIPEVVSQRMVKRMALFCGLPTLLGLATFPLSYVIVSQGWLELPNVAVLLVSMGGFGLGVLGLSYGALSASWDEEARGSALGWTEFRTNFGRVLESWRGARSQ